jgi:S-adenosyl-L-methionine hydrolase (adenosine-forming)
MHVITLLTDFGTADGYVAEVKGVILAALPDATLVDVTHDVEPGDVERARYVLSRTWHRFPAGTVHLVVVDPGVGTERRCIAVRASDHWFVGPDNGVLSPALNSAGAAVVQLPVPESVSATFHGRDVFAPVAARIAAARATGGAPLHELGPPVSDPIILAVPSPTPGRDGSVRGEVVAIDRFGNAVTNIEWHGEDAAVQVGGRVLPLRRTYGEVASGDPLALTGSSGCVEIAIREGSAAQALGLRRGSVVTLLPAPPETR